MTSSENCVQVESDGRVRIIRLNRPDALNAFNDEQYDGVTAALSEAADDPDVAVVVITGTGRAFTAGQDLQQMGTPPTYNDGKRHGFTPFIETVEAFPKPLIAAVNGLGVGIGLTLLPHCDLVLMAEDARLRAPFVSLGVTVEAGNSQLLPLAVGWANAARILYTTDWIQAPECLELGLVWKVVASGDLMAETLSIAGRIAAMPVASLVTTKKLLLAARLEGTRAAREREQPAFAALVGGPANREAISAFEEKRDADFTNLAEG